MDLAVMAALPMETSTVPAAVVVYVLPVVLLVFVLVAAVAVLAIRVSVALVAMLVAAAVAMVLEEQVQPAPPQRAVLAVMLPAVVVELEVAVMPVVPAVPEL